jgi:hypothetical protein
MHAVAVRPVEREVAERTREEQQQEPTGIRSRRPLPAAPPPDERGEGPQQHRPENRNQDRVRVTAVVQHVAEPLAAEAGVEEIGVRQVGGEDRQDRGDRTESRRGLCVRATRASRAIDSASSSPATEWVTLSMENELSGASAQCCHAPPTSRRSVAAVPNDWSRTDRGVMGPNTASDLMALASGLEHPAHPPAP